MIIIVVVIVFLVLQTRVDIREDRPDVIRESHIGEIIVNLRLNIFDHIIELVSRALYGSKESLNQISTCTISFLLIRRVELFEQVIDNRKDAFNSIDHSGCTWWIGVASVGLDDRDDSFQRTPHILSTRACFGTCGIEIATRTGRWQCSG